MRHLTEAAGCKKVLSARLLFSSDSRRFGDNSASHRRFDYEFATDLGYCLPNDLNCVLFACDDEMVQA